MQQGLCREPDRRSGAAPRRCRPARVLGSAALLVWLACSDGGPRANIVEAEDLGAGWACGEPEGCTADYLALPGLAATVAAPISRLDLLEQIQQIESGRVAPFADSIPEEELRDALLDALNVRFLLDGMDGRQLRVTTIRKDETTAYHERELLFEDPYVGTLEGILLTPDGKGPFPGIVAVHGHRDDAAVYRDRFHGGEYPSHGYAILMLTMRAMGIDSAEHAASRELLMNGFTLIGIPVYETLLGLEYLRHLPEVADDRIGLIGHSGGSSASNLTIRLATGFRAYVSDLTIDYSEWGTILEQWHCETVPALFPYHLLVNDFGTSSVPVLEVPYGYTNGMDEIFRFFDSLLKG